MPVSAPTGKPSTSAITISREQSGPLVPAGSSSQTSGQSATTILSFQAGTNKYFLKRRGSSQAKKSVVEVIPHSNKRQRLTPASIVPLSGLELSQHVTIPESNPPAMEDDTEAYEEHDNSKVGSSLCWIHRRVMLITKLQAVPTLPVPQGGSPNLQQLMVAGGAVESASSIAPSKDVIFPGMTRSSLQPGIFVASSTLLSRFGRCIDNPRDTRAILEDAKALPVSASTASSSIASSSFMVALSELRSTKGYVGAAVDDAQSRILYLAVVEDNINVERELSIMGLVSCYLRPVWRERSRS
ncbi:hypothetical protein BCR39DRAFT_368758 [Naematelia encephala]|uniref:Uncharacterized protein n=1 Tax=Naematelia encephala TaxID=71784 RepID=A0A1Y2AK65_9TREE|nr:hypothetical protein BCR39DRAFT_368758 [Naematelia encephala]